MYTITIKPDGDGFLAEVKERENIFAWGESPAEAKKWLMHVVEMMMDFHLEQFEQEKKIKHHLLHDHV